MPLFAMPYASRKHIKRLDPRGPLVFDTRTLSTGSVRTEDRVVPAPAELGVELVSIPAGADLELHVQLEGVAEGTLVTATASAPLAGECARCLEPVTSATWVRLQELFAYEPPESETAADGYVQDGDLLDLEPALRDALVLELPLAPLCSDDCSGALHRVRRQACRRGCRTWPCPAGRRGPRQVHPGRDPRAGAKEGALRWLSRSGECHAATPGPAALSGRPPRPRS